MSLTHPASGPALPRTRRRHSSVRTFSRQSAWFDNTACSPQLSPCPVTRNITSCHARPSWQAAVATPDAAYTLKHTVSHRQDSQQSAPPSPSTAPSIALQPRPQKPAPELPVPLKALQGLPLPRHIAVIMDGNARWARQQSLPVTAGHEAGVRALIELVRNCRALDIKALTVFAFSTENWNRPAAEVEFLMRLFQSTIDTWQEELHREGVRLLFIGERHKLPQSLQQRMDRAEAATADNAQLLLTIAVSYSARADMAQAARRVALLASQGSIRPEQVTESTLDSHLSTALVHSLVGPPDLLIRSSGEQRLSNFLLYESAYAELYFSSAHWPAFDAEGLAAALIAYSSRHRRFGCR